MSKPSREATVTSQRVMEQLSHEIPKFNLDKRFITIQQSIGGSYEISLERLIITRYAEAIQEQLDETSFFRERGREVTC